MPGGLQQFTGFQGRSDPFDLAGAARGEAGQRLRPCLGLGVPAGKSARSSRPVKGAASATHSTSSTGPSGAARWRTATGHALISSRGTAGSHIRTSARSGPPSSPRVSCTRPYPTGQPSFPCAGGGSTRGSVSSSRMPVATVASTVTAILVIDATSVLRAFPASRRGHQHRPWVRLRRASSPYASSVPRGGGARTQPDQLRDAHSTWSVRVCTARSSRSSSTSAVVEVTDTVTAPPPSAPTAGLP